MFSLWGTFSDVVLQIEFYWYFFDFETRFTFKNLMGWFNTWLGPFCIRESHSWHMRRSDVGRHVFEMWTLSARSSFVPATVQKALSSLLLYYILIQAGNKWRDTDIMQTFLALKWSPSQWMLFYRNKVNLFKSDLYNSSICWQWQAVENRSYHLYHKIQ